VNAKFVSLVFSTFTFCILVYSVTMKVNDAVLYFGGFHSDDSLDCDLMLRYKWLPLSQIADHLQDVS
jgi:hypothetical protein